MLKVLKDETYIIAEIGQNHNGDVQIAKKIIDQLDRYPYDEITGNRLNKVNAIKLTKRDLSEELSIEGMNKPYTGKHSFGATYGEHREFLELSYEDHVELGNYIKSKGFEFVETLCSVKTLQLLDMVKVDKIKVASRDLTNIPLIEAIAKRPEAVILSTGMADIDDVLNVVAIFEKEGKSNFSILHCLSQYPAEYEKVNLNTIPFLKNVFKEIVIGYSDHTLGTHIPVAAVALGAKIIEKHVTLDRNMKGTDHAGSADIETFYNMVHDIRTLELSFGVFDIVRDPVVESAKSKLERSLALKIDKAKGDIIREEDLHMISPGDGLKWEHRSKFVGKPASQDYKANTLLS